MEKQSNPFEQPTRFHFVSSPPRSSAFSATKWSIKFVPELKKYIYMEKQTKTQFRNKQNSTFLHFFSSTFSATKQKNFAKTPKEKGETKKTRLKNEQIEAKVPVSALKLQNILAIRSLNTHILSFHGINFLTGWHRPNRV